MHHALLIEDEATARADLRAKLAAHPDIQILAEAATVKSSRGLLARTDYDLVFLDIQLVKPVAPERLAEALRRLGETPAATEDNDTGKADGPILRLDDTVYLRSGLQARFAPVADISVIFARDNYSEVRLADGLRKSLKAWEDALPSRHFMRVHRTQIVNLSRVTRYERDGDEHTLLHVVGASAPVPASRDRWNELRDRLAAIRPTP